MCVVEGRRSVESAVLAGARVRELVVSEEMLRDPEVTVLAKSVDVVLVASVKDLERVSDVKTSQGVLAVVSTRWVALESLRGVERVVVLDGVQDPGNVGTIIRTAAWFGIDGVLSGPGVADCYGPKVLRASMGGVWDLQLARSDDLESDLRELSLSGFDLFAAHLDGEPVDAWRPERRAALILGSEAHGPSSEVLSLGTGRVRIPGRRSDGVTESLNVAVAAGILMFRWTLAS